MRLPFARRYLFSFTIVLGLWLPAAGCGGEEIALANAVIQRVEEAYGEMQVADKQAADKRATVDAQVVDGVLEVDIYSPSGIGRTMIPLDAEPSPAAVVLRLHLDGLENIRVATDKAVVTASVLPWRTSDAVAQPPSQPAQILQELSVTFGEGEKDESIDSQHPLWLTIEWVEPAAGERYFTISIPPALWETAHSLEVEWIDFYR